MESRTLNFVDAMKLAQILSKYIDTESIKKTDTFLDLAESIMNKIEPSDYSKIIQILTNEPIEEIGKLSGNEILSLFISGLEINKVITLLESFKKIGDEIGSK